MSEWREIDTAPKDGSRFDGWGYAIPDSGIMPDKNVPERHIECFWGERDSSYVKRSHGLRGWCSTGHDGWAWGMVLTHWMPIPEPPRNKTS